MPDDRPTIDETQALVLKLAQVTDELDAANRAIAAIVSLLGYCYGELKGFTHPKAVYTRDVLGTIIDEHGPKRTPEPYVLDGIVAESYMHGQQLIDREERAREHAQ